MKSCFSASVSLPVAQLLARRFASLDPRRSSSVNRRYSKMVFPLLQSPFNIFFTQIIQKMAPEALSLLREVSPHVDAYMANEAKKRNFVVKSAMMSITADNIQVLRGPDGFAASSLIFQDVNEARLDSLLKFWEDRLPNLDVDTAMIHLAGSKVSYATAENLECAKDTIDYLDRYEIGVEDLTLIACTSKATEQMLSHLQPKSFGIECCDFAGDGKNVEKIVIDQIYNDLREVRVVGEEYPATIVEAYLKCFQKSESGLSRLHVSFPEQKLPQEPFLGMECRLLNNFQNSFTILFRSDEMDPRHVLLRGEREAGRFQLDFCRIVDSDDLLFKMFGVLYMDNMTCIGLSEYSPAELRKIFECPW